MHQAPLLAAATIDRPEKLIIHCPETACRGSRQRATSFMLVVSG